MIEKVKPGYYYTLVAILATVFWYFLNEFATIQRKLHARFFTTVIVVFVVAVCAVSGWYESKRKKPRGRR